MTATTGSPSQARPESTGRMQSTRARQRRREVSAEPNSPRFYASDAIAPCSLACLYSLSWLPGFRKLRS